ncbi:MAG: hypothetical protein ACRDTT_34770 [Pseudonocardiaceae bacterium]
MAGWITLRRAHRGGVGNLDGWWLDSGHRVPGYVADALDRFTRTGLLALGEANTESCGVRRVTVTDTGCARYLALCHIHNATTKATVSIPRRWACSPHDRRSHLLAEPGTDQIGAWVAICGHRMLWSVPISAQPTGPRCPTCEALPAMPEHALSNVLTMSSRH